MKLTINNQTKGTAIVLVISILATLMVIVGVALEYTMNIGRNVQRSNTLGSAIAVADGCLEHTFAEWRSFCRQPGIPKPPTSTELNNLPLPSVAQFPDIPNFTVTRNIYNPASTATVQQLRVEAVDPQLQPVATGDSPPADAGDGNVLTKRSLRAAHERREVRDRQLLIGCFRDRVDVRRHGILQGAAASDYERRAYGGNYEFFHVCVSRF